VFVSLEDGAARVLSAAPWLGGEPTGETIEGVDAHGISGSTRRLAPVEPSKILCVGRNYRAHAKELGNEVPAAPLLFFKPPSALVGPDDSIELPPASISERVEHEAEIAIVVGERLRRASPESAARAVFGVTLALDVTARDLQKKDGQWTRAKGMDTFCPAGPVVVTGIDAMRLSFECAVGGAMRQRGETRDMIFGVATVLSYASQVMTLEPGDLLLTGTPEGVGPLSAGDIVEVRCSDVGSLRLPVVSSPTA
jgi:2-keto-4-pentenoate hydratase/2-oxohepta-3-ene-1,7-dioic acid hydratase in catechol pathway